MSKIISSLFLTCTMLFSITILAANSWKIVPSKEVCMVTDMHFGRAQIPVEQAGKTYYGCCENCKATIQNDAKLRTATDPQSKKSVDKSKATIAANETGAVLYFENKASFDKFVAINSSKVK